MDLNVASGMKMNDIVTIATLLRDKGDKILNFSCKLTLTIDFLINLNEAFDLIVDKIESACFHVINTNNSAIEFLHDLQFLHDFVQKVVGLRLWSKSFVDRNKVSLEKFRALRILDLYAVHIQSIGISNARDKLKSLTCARSNLPDLRILLEPEALEHIDMENEVLDSNRIWACLEELFLPHNGIECLGSSLRCVPSLRVLDLSHNALTDLSSLNHCSQNLELLNVSSNRLKELPTLNHCTKMKILLLSDNRLEDLKGLDNLFSLIHVDASRNLIKEHSCLATLMYLPCLKRLQLIGNPIAFKRGHRLLTIAYINPTALSSQTIFLDEIQVSSMEKSHFPQKRPFGSKFTCGGLQESYRQSDCSFQAIPTQSTIYPEQQGVSSFRQPKHTQDIKLDLATSTRSVRIREAPIAEGEECQTNKVQENQSDADLVPVSQSAVHLETKRNIESLRKTFGEENWLQGGGGLRILDILGIQVGSSSNSPHSLDSPLSSQSSGGEVISQGEVCVGDNAAELKDVEGEEEVGEEDAMEANEEEEAVEADVIEMDRRRQVQEENENGAELGVFVVQRKRNEKDQLLMDDLLLIVTKRFLIERDGTNGDIVARWDLSRLRGVLAEEGEDETNGKWVLVTFKGRFDMADKQSYFLDYEEAKELMRILDEMLEEMHTSARNNAVQFMCIRCSANFFDSNLHDDLEAGKSEGDSSCIPKCPKCGSSVVVHAAVSEENDSPLLAGVADSSVVAGISPNKDVSAVNSEHKSPFACWAGSHLSASEKTSSDASNHGLELYVMLNVLPDGEGKENEFNIHEALVFQVNAEESFHGHIVLSKDSIYVLREAVRDERDSGERKMPSEESAEPILVEWHLLSNCQTITYAYSGYIFHFGPQPSSCLWVYPRQQKQMHKAVDSLCKSHLELQYFQNGNNRSKAVSGFEETLMAVPLVSFSFLSSCDPQEESDKSDSSKLQPGLLVLTAAAIAIMEFKELHSYMSDFGHRSSYNKNVSDLVGLDAVCNSFLGLPGLVLQFSGEADDDKCLVWPWGEGVLLEFVEALRKPWENLFSIPLEAIAAQTDV